MKHYSKRRDLKKAIADSVAGGQALFTHLWTTVTGPDAYKGTKLVGKLFDQDRERLITAAQDFGETVIVVHRLGTPKQHIDLVGGPLERAIKSSNE